MKMKSLLQNKYVLYVVLFIAVTNVLGYLAIEDFDSVACFAAIGALTSYFSKNMIVILGVALIGTNIVFANNRILEGMSHGKKDKKNKKDKISEIEKEKKDKKDKKDDDEEEDEEGFGQRNVPSSKPAKAGADEEEEDGVSRIDHAATMEQAYDNLNKMLGKGGMKNLTNDTKGLMNQQKDLMEQLKGFAPLMEQAGDMLDKLGGMDNLQGLMGKLGGLNGLTGSKKNK